MPQINATLTPYTHTGPSLDLSTAAFAGSLSRVYRTSTNGQGWVAYVPGSNLNSFTSLETGKGYIILASAFPFTIPDAADPVPALQSQITALQQQVSSLQAQLAAPPVAPTAAVTVDATNASTAQAVAGYNDPASYEIQDA